MSLGTGIRLGLVHRGISTDSESKMADALRVHRAEAAEAGWIAD